MLAEPFTRENAGDMARKATISREANRKARLLASSPEYANQRAVKQVNRVLSWMEKETDRKAYSELAALLDRLWNKAYPTAGSLRPRSQKPSRSTPVEPLNPG